MSNFDTFMDGLGEDEKAQILRLKDLTRRTGQLHDLQVLQLKVWPYMLFTPEGGDSEAKVDLEEKTVTWDVRMSKVPRGKDLRVRGEALEGWTRTLLGDEWVVEVKARQKKGGTARTIFRGTRLVDVRKPVGPVKDLKAYEFERALTEFKQYGSFDEAKAATAVEDLPPLDVELKGKK